MQVENNYITNIPIFGRLLLYCFININVLNIDIIVSVLSYFRL